MSKDEKGPPLRAGDPRLSKKEEVVSLNNKAFGMIKSSTREAGKWKVVSLSYDLETNTAKIDSVEEYESKSFALNKFKVKVANEF